MLEGQPCLISRALPSSCEQESKWIYMHYHLLEISSGGKGKRPAADDAARAKKKPLNHHDHDHDHDHHSNCLIPALGRDLSISCLIRCSRSDYGALAALSQSFRALVNSGDLYRFRRQNKIVEHWVYFSCSVLEWEAFDPGSKRWMHLPRMPLPNECFVCSDKESLAVGTDLLVFGREMNSQIVLRYSILSNAWTPGPKMNTPRCLFGSASLGAVAIVAGGCSPQGGLFASAELYDSETRTWVELPRLNTPRKMCSGVFMDGKFYVIGGTGAGGALSCGEEFDLREMRWRVIENMFPVGSGSSGAPPLLAVVKNELYAADYAENLVRRYVKGGNRWVTLGRLPERSASVNGWGLAFRACGDRLIVIGGRRTGGGGGSIEINAWVPGEGPPRWELVAAKASGGFVYNCAVMGC
ncbi:F-box/kelch-repeat protein SKIP11-like [Wolffia australiana]